MRIPGCFYLLFSLLICIQSAGQEVIPRFETIGVNDGLSQNSVNSIYQDSRGYMWFGTGDGLNRYDGNSITVFKIAYNEHAPANSNTIRDRFREDKKGNIWFATELGLHYFDRKEERIVTELAWDSKEELKKYKWYGVVYLDEHDNIYLYNYSPGVLQYNTGTKTLTDISLEPVYNPDGFGTFSSIDKRGNLWFRRRAKDGVYVFDIHTRTFSRRLGNRDVLDICFGKNKVYILETGGLYIADSLMHLQDSILPDMTQPPMALRSVFEDAFERPWILTEGKGLLRYNPLTKKLFPFSGSRASRVFDFPIVMYNDRNNNLWVGTEGDGVCKIDIKPKKFNVFPVNKDEYPELTRYFIKSLSEDTGGRTWFGTYGNGFFIFDKEHATLQGNRTAGDFAGAILLDKAGNMWLGGNKGIFVCRGKKVQKVHTPGADPDGKDGFVTRFLQLPDGRIVAATCQGIMMIYEKNGDLTGRLMKGFKGGKVSDMVTTADGDTWISVRYRGIQRVRFSNDTLEVKETLLPGSYIGDLHVDETEPGILWACADKGLIRLSILSKKIRLYNESYGMANSHVYGVMEDSLHNLWMSTNGGISCLNRKTQTFTNYTVKDGLQSNEFNSGAFYKNEKGVMYFGGINGFNWFSPCMPVYDTVRPLLEPGKVIIDDSLVKWQDHAQDGTITIGHQKKTISFSFVVLDYTQPNANMIAYTLDDGESKWYKTYNKTIVFSNLSPGEYTLRVKGINSQGVESSIKKIKFTVLPPFWKTSWFGLLAAVVTTLVVILVTRNIAQQKLKKQLAELEQQREIEKERQRISREMHDDIGAGLTQITLMSEMAKSRLVSNDQKELQDIASTSRKLVNSMSEIIWSLNPEGRNLEQLFAYLRETLHQLMEYSGIAYTINFPEHADNISLSDEQRRNMLLLVKEAVNNAVKYSKATDITVSAIVTGVLLTFRISDNGQGFDVAKVVRGNGLKNMERRAQDLGGSLDITSASEGGTTVCITIPLKSHSLTGK